MPYEKPREPEPTEDGEPLREPTWGELVAEVTRDPHDPTMLPPLEHHKFVTAQMVMFLNDYKINRKGDVVVSFMVPFRYRHFATPLQDAYGIPLSVDFQRWKLYDTVRESIARDTRPD